jgi:hypothetical protein
MNINNYKTELNILDKHLEAFDGNIADNNYQELKEMFQRVYQSGLLQITHLEKELQDKLKLELFITLTKHSGTLAFLVIQILAANNIMVKNNFLRHTFYKEKYCGIAINHLRAPDTYVSAIKVDGGYKLSGKLTWASGYKIFDYLCIGFHFENKEYETMAGFTPHEGFLIQNTDDTFVGFGLNTVNIQLKNFFVKDEDIVSSNEKGNYTKNKSSSKTVHFCLYGLGELVINEIDDIELQSVMRTRLERFKVDIINEIDPDKLDMLRVELFSFVQSSITTTMIQIGGSSILSEQTLQRGYRELMMFNSNGLNTTLKELFKTHYFDTLN